MFSFQGVQVWNETVEAKDVAGAAPAAGTEPEKDKREGRTGGERQGGKERERVCGRETERQNEGAEESRGEEINTDSEWVR